MSADAAVGHAHGDVHVHHTSIETLIRAIVRDEIAAVRAQADDAIIPIDVAAAELGIRPRVIRDAATRGEITLGGAGRRRVVTRAELRRWVESRPVQTAHVAAPDDRGEATSAIARAAARWSR